MVTKELLILVAILVIANSQTIPENCTWSKNDCEELETSRDFNINCDKRNKTLGGTVYSCKEACSILDNFLCSYDYCIGYKNWCLTSKSSTPPLTSTPPSSFPSALCSSITTERPNTTETPRNNTSRQEITSKSSGRTESLPSKKCTLEIVLIVLLSLFCLIPFFLMIGFDKDKFSRRWRWIKVKLQKNNKRNTRTPEDFELPESPTRDHADSAENNDIARRQASDNETAEGVMETTSSVEKPEDSLLQQINHLHTRLKQKLKVNPEYWAKVEKACKKKKEMQRPKSESRPSDLQNLSTTDGGASETERLLHVSNDTSERIFTDFTLCEIYYMIQLHGRQGEDPQGEAP
ncbi:uncharacterized protein [Watersipora subatra]|uniref:uncharacterized protein n=1 Tax=Watersipora subatra TaxID=2589382 RepID=UPI00355C53DD